MTERSASSRLLSSSAARVCVVLVAAGAGLFLSAAIVTTRILARGVLALVTKRGHEGGSEA